MSDSVENLIEGLKLDRENILQGNIQAVLDASGLRESQFIAIDQSAQFDALKLVQLKSLAHSNSGLLRSAIEGMQAARSRYRQRGRRAPSLQTYSREGAQKKLGSNQGGFEIRA